MKFALSMCIQDISHFAKIYFDASFWGTHETTPTSRVEVFIISRKF